MVDITKFSATKISIAKTDKKKNLSPEQREAKLIEAEYNSTAHESRIKNAQEELMDRGFVTVRLHRGSKSPVGDKWQVHGHMDKNAYQGYNNLGVVLGDKSEGLVDIDIDDDNLLDIADQFLPPTPMKFGRFYNTGVQRLGHWLYRVEKPGKLEKVKMPDGGTAIEYRSNGGQTMFPPSAIWDGDNPEFPEGYLDCVMWENKSRILPKDDPAHSTREYLNQAIRVMTVSYYAADFFKKKSYHDDMLAWSGFLLRCGIDEDLCVKSVKYIVKMSGQENLEDRLKEVKSTKELIETGVTNGIRGINYLEYDAGWDKAFCQWLRRVAGANKEELQDGRPKVLIVDSKETEWIDKTLDAMVETKKFYNQGGLIVTVVREHGESAKLLALADTISAGSWLTREILFTRNVLDKATQQFMESKVVCPKSISSEIANISTSKGRVLPINGTCTTPLITKHGRVIEDTWEYDAELRLFFACEYGITPMYKDEALYNLAEILSDFPFTSSGLGFLDDLELQAKDETHKPMYNRYLAASISAILTAVIRPALDICPMYVITSSQHSDGKSVLSGVIAAAVGVEASVGQLTRGGNDEEQEKQLSAILSKGRRVVTLDNHDGEFRSMALTEVLTSTNPEFRILGKNETRTIPNKTMFLLNGVNTTPALDLQTRSVFIKLARTDLNPNRKFKHNDVVGYATASKESLVSSAINLIEWALKQPDGNWKPNHRFKVWDKMVRRTIQLVCGIDIAPPASEDTDRALDPMEESRYSLLHFVLHYWQTTSVSRKKNYFRAMDIAQEISPESEEEGWINALSKRPRQELSLRCGYALGTIKEHPVKDDDGDIWRMEAYVVKGKSAYRMIKCSGVV